MLKLKTLFSIFSAIVVLAACQATTHRFKSASPTWRPYDQKVYGFMSKPSGKGPFPAVILLHGGGGLGPHHMIDWPDFLTGLGYAVLAIDSYGPRGMSTRLDAGFLESLEWQSLDAIGALDSFAKLPEIDENLTAVMGFSRGGRAINNILIPDLIWGEKKSSQGLEFKAAIAFYGACETLYSISKAPFPVMQIIGDQDPIAVGCLGVEKVENVELKILPGAYHAFDNERASGRHDFGGKYMEYSATAVGEARKLTKDFLGKHLRK